MGHCYGGSRRIVPRLSLGSMAVLEFLPGIGHDQRLKIFPLDFRFR
jgi:hypothetical protein